VKSVSTQLKSLLDAKSIEDASAITRRFQAHLVEEVKAKVKARLLWFVARYPGGRPDISRNQKLKSCLDEQIENSDAALVTGVAGYIVIDNKIDTAIGSAATVENALDASFAGQASAALLAQLKASLGSNWKKSVDAVAQIKTARQDLSTVAWPLWVQLQ
jgi:hypothetical protein